MHSSRLSMPAFAIPQSSIIGNLGENLEDFSADIEEFEGNSAEGDSMHTPQVSER